MTAMFCYSCDGNSDLTAKCRMVNDAHLHPAKNAVMKIIDMDGPHLCLFALRNIQPNEEIRFDYGIADLPWRKKVPKSIYTLLEVNFFDNLPKCQHRASV